MIVINLVDVLLLTLVVIWAVHALNSLSAFRDPVRCTAFGLFAIGAFGCIASDVAGHALHWWELSLHAGGATYALVKIVSHRTQLGQHHELPRQSPGRPV